MRSRAGNGIERVRILIYCGVRWRDSPEHAKAHDLLEISRMAMRINVAKEWRRLEAPVEERTRALVA